MVYKVIGLMSGSSLDGLDICYVHLHELAGNWTYEIVQTKCCEYSSELSHELKEAINLDALQYQLLHASYGHYIGAEVNKFIEDNKLNHQVDLVVSHGHTSFHMPPKLMTAQLGDGAAVAAETGLPVVTDLRALDVALGGQGAPLVPAGEWLLFAGYDYFLNLGGIANISVKNKDVSSQNKMIAFDICPANRILNMLAGKKDILYDDEGTIAASGNTNFQLLKKLNDQDFYKQPYPKSLSNSFGTDIAYPIINSFEIPLEDKMRTYVDHISTQIKDAIINGKFSTNDCQLMVTGGGAFNKFMMSTIKNDLQPLGIKITIPENDLVNFKEALIMALLGVLRWREEYTVMNSVTGAKRNSIGGALWLGTEA